MTKAAICTACGDLVSPRHAWQTDRSWRWCECDHVAVRWRDGDRGLLEVASLHGPDGVRVLGLNNAFLHEAVHARSDAEGWRAWHAGTCAEVEPHYLFHRDKRNCWAVIVQVGETGDVFLMDYATARPDDRPDDRPDAKAEVGA